MKHTEELHEALLDLEGGSGFYISRNGEKLELSKEELFQAYDYQQDIFYHDMIIEYIESEAASYDMLFLAGGLKIDRLVAAVRKEVDKYSVTDIEALQNIIIPEKTISDGEEIIRDFYCDYIAYDSEISEQAISETCKVVTSDLMINQGYSLNEIKNLSETNYMDNKLSEIVNNALSELSLAGVLKADLQACEPEL